MTSSGQSPARQVFMFLNGPLNPPPDLPPSPPEGARVVAVDGGAVHCLSLGWPIDLLMGDFDSLPEAVLERLKVLQPRLDIRIYRRDKDETDFELALGLLRPHAPDLGRLVVLGGLGGRWDMTLANLLVPLAGASGLSRGRGRRPSLVFRDGNWDLHVLRGPAALDFPPSEIERRVSLIPLGGRVGGATLAGPFKYPLAGDELRPGRTRGLSNELGLAGGRLSIRSGVLLASVSPLGDEGFIRPEPRL